MFRDPCAGGYLLRRACYLVDVEVIMDFKKQALDVVQGENAKAMVKILQDENKRICEELKDMKEQRDNALKIAENAILELRGRG